MPLSADEESEVVALIAQTLAQYEGTFNTRMAMGEMIVAALEEAGWGIEAYDPGPDEADPGLELHHEFTPLERDLMRSLPLVFGGSAKIVPFPTRWS